MPLLLDSCWFSVATNRMPPALIDRGELIQTCYHVIIIAAMKALGFMT